MRKQAAEKPPGQTKTSENSSLFLNQKLPPETKENQVLASVRYLAQSNEIIAATCPVET
ncbi:MAG: hypothetical protein PHZ14_05095 [Sulfuricella sp.]|nr:hypothetical protein [Sulfuricella sp.]